MSEEQGRQIANLMGMAGTAERAQNNEEAISYYNRVLEADPTYSEAWLGKGRAAGWLSSLANVRINETLVAFGHAIATAADEFKQDVAARANQDVTALANALYGMARKHYKEHGTVQSAVATYLTVSGQLLDALETARPWKPGDRASLETSVLISRHLVDRGGTPEYVVAMKTILNNAIEQIRQTDPTYAPPQLASKSEMQTAADKAEVENLGWIVLFIVVIIAAVIGAANRH